MKRILLMYHCRRVRRQVRSALRDRYDVFAAHGTSVTERLVRIRKPDVILVDQGGSNGTAAAMLTRLRHDHSRIPVIALARFHAQHGTMEARRLGAGAVVRWPCPVQRLFAAIANALGVGSRTGVARRGERASGDTQSSDALLNGDRIAFGEFAGRKRRGRASKQVIAGRCGDRPMDFMVVGRG